jgi:putative DNA primase/helicase
VPWTHDPAGKVYLSPDDYHVLSTGSAISDPVIGARQYQTIPRDSRGITRLHELKVPNRFREPKTKRLPGLLIPLRRPTGDLISYQFRPLEGPTNDKGRIQKYTSPRGRRPVVDVHPFNTDRIADPSIELWIVEGTKKADALTSRGICAVALSGIWNWRHSHGTLGDWEDIPLKGRRAVICFDSDAQTNRNVARAMIRLGAWLRSKGAAKIRYLVVPGDPAAKIGADDFLAAGGTLDQLAEAATSKPPDTGNTDDTFTDARMAETIADDVLADRFIWVPGLGWLTWTGQRWADCAEETVVEHTRLYTLERFQRAVAGASNGRTNTTAIDGWRSMLARPRMTAALALARVAVMHTTDQLDADPDILNTPDGIIDLTDGTVHPHQPEALCTKITRGSYRPGYTHPDWTTALQALPTDTEPWFQTLTGQAITGHPSPNDIAVLLRGAGENGKTVIVGYGIIRAAGSYATVAGPGLLAKVRDGAASPDRMMLRGARFVLIEEMTEGRALDVTALKQITGVGRITTRQLYQKDVTFDETHTLFVTSNYLPVVNETDHGVWRRLLRVEFPYRFRADDEPLESALDRPGDEGLKPRMKEGADGQYDAVITWLVEGAKRWHANRAALRPPKRVRDDTFAWRANADRILGFWHDWLIAQHSNTTTHAVRKDDLYDAFNQWLSTNGHERWSKELFHTRFREHSVTQESNVEERRPRADSLDKMTVSDPPKELLRHDGTFLDPRPHVKRPRIYVGLRFRTEDDAYIEDAPEEGGPTGPKTHSEKVRTNSPGPGNHADQQKHQNGPTRPNPNENSSSRARESSFQTGWTAGPGTWTRASALAPCTLCHNGPTLMHYDNQPAHPSCVEQAKKTAESKAPA